MEYLLIYLVEQIDDIKILLTILSLFILFPSIVCFTVIYIEQERISKIIYLILLGSLILIISVLIPNSETLTKIIAINLN